MEYGTVDLTDLYDDSELVWNAGVVLGPGDVDGQVAAADDARDGHAVVQLATRKRERVDTWRLCYTTHRPAPHAARTLHFTCHSTPGNDYQTINQSVNQL